MSDLKLYEIAADIEAAIMADELDEELLNSLVESMEAKAEAVMVVTDKLNCAKQKKSGSLKSASLQRTGRTASKTICTTAWTQLVLLRCR